MNTRTWKRKGVEVHGARAVLRSSLIVVQTHPSFQPSRANLYLPWAKHFSPAQATTLAVSLARTNARCFAITSIFRNLPKPSPQYLETKKIKWTFCYPAALFPRLRDRRTPTAIAHLSDVGGVEKPLGQAGRGEVVVGRHERGCQVVPVAAD